MWFLRYGTFAWLFTLCAEAGEDMCSDVLVDNFGIGGGQGSEDERPYDKSGLDHVLKHPVCEYYWREFDEIPDAVIEWFPNGQQYASFIGVDMVPKRNFEFHPQEGLALQSSITQLSLWKRGKNGPPEQSETIKIGHCSAREQDGGGWILQRLGPFYSNGAYDWWAMQMRDVWHLTSVMAEHPDGVYWTSALLAAASDRNEILGLPPIHLHHIHVGAQPGELGKTTYGTLYFDDEMLEVHGDYECSPNKGGANCLVQKPAFDNVRDVYRVQDLTSELNDVRAPASPSLKWWFQMAIRWHPKAIGKLVPESQNSFGKNVVLIRNYANRTLSKDENVPIWSHRQSENDPYGTLGKGPQMPQNDEGFWPIRNQFDLAGTFGLNASERTIAWATSPMFNGGEMLRSKIHSHNAMFERFLFFRASPHELGLVGGTHHFPFHNAYEFTLLQDTGFENFDDVHLYFNSNLASAARKYDKKCDPSSSFRPECDFNKPFLICRATPSDIEVYDESLKQFFQYDRRQATCCNRWTFKMGEVTTIIGFYNPIIRPVGPWSLMIPKEFPMHLSLWLDFKFQSPVINGKPTFKMGHSYFMSQDFGPTGSSFVPVVGGDIWDYLLRLPQTFAPTLITQGTQNLACLWQMSWHRWKDGLYDSPNDVASMVANGDYSKYTDSYNYMPSPAAVSAGIFKQWVLIGVICAGFVLMSLGYTSCKRKA